MKRTQKQLRILESTARKLSSIEDQLSEISMNETELSGSDLIVAQKVRGLCSDALELLNTIGIDEAVQS